MKEQNLNLDIEELVDEFDDYQYDVSTELSAEFIDNTLMPMLDEFDYGNSNPDYIPGVASFGLYIKLVQALLEEGFTKEQLVETVNEFSVHIVDGPVH
jgi:hypothetical protein